MKQPLVFALTTAALGLIAGVDEVGRGPLAGDVVAAAVILDPTRPIPGLADSKQLTEARREALCEIILAQALTFAVARATVEEIDNLNILQASLLAMHRAVTALHIQPDFIYVDGNRLPRWSYSAEAVVKGDSRIAAVAAASIDVVQLSSVFKKEDEKDEMKEAIDTINTLRSELQEINLLNAKLLFVNKIFSAKNLTESQKVKVIASFDKATTPKQAKELYESIQSSTIGASKKSQIKESLGFASKAAGVAPKNSANSIVESNDVIARMQKLANIIK